MSIIPTRDTFEIELLSFYYQCLASSDQAWTKCQHAFLKHSFLKRESLVLTKRQQQAITEMEDNSVFEEEDDSVGIQDDQNESIKIEHHIVYSTSYQVPVMYFQAFFQDGTPLDLKDIYQHIIPKYYHQELTGLPQNSISQTEHPELGSPFWYIHPCDTRVLMDSIGFKSSCHHHDYIKTWLSFYGPLVKCKLSTTLFK